MYDYYAEVLNIVDADTLDLFTDKGTDDFKKMRIRFAKIDAPERGTIEGKAAQNWLINLLSNPDKTYKPIYLFTLKDKKEKYGRYLGEFWLWGEDFTKIPSINDRMVEAGHAVYKNF